MMAATHAAFSTVSYLGGAAVFEYPVDPLSWGLAVFCSLLPDIDLPTSTLGRMLFWLSVPLEKRFGHRTITHSLVGIATFAALALPLYLTSYHAHFWSAIGGYWSHLQLDMVNVRGVDLFWPSSLRVVIPGKVDYRIEVGSKVEMTVLVALLAFCAFLYPVSSVGLRGGMHQLLKDFDLEYSLFVQVQGLHWYTLDLKAVDNLTLDHIQCHCPVLGAWQDGLIVEYQGKIRSVGRRASFIIICIPLAPCWSGVNPCGWLRNGWR